MPGRMDGKWTSVNMAIGVEMQDQSLVIVTMCKISCA